jgi:hypothetical protein
MSRFEIRGSENMSMHSRELRLYFSKLALEVIMDHVGEASHATMQLPYQLSCLAHDQSSLNDAVIQTQSANVIVFISHSVVISSNTSGRWTGRTCPTLSGRNTAAHKHNEHSGISRASPEDL